MYSLYIFGAYVENQFTDVFGPQGKWLYLLMYMSSLFACLLPTYNKNKDNYNYRSLGASGAVSAVVFAFIFLEPLRKIGIIFIPVMIPGFIFGFLYLVLSSVFDKRGRRQYQSLCTYMGRPVWHCFFNCNGNFLARYHLLESFLRQVGSYIHSF